MWSTFGLPSIRIANRGASRNRNTTQQLLFKNGAGRQRNLTSDSEIHLFGIQILWKKISNNFDCKCYFPYTEVIMISVGVEYISYINLSTWRTHSSCLYRISGNITADISCSGLNSMDCNCCENRDK